MRHWSITGHHAHLNLHTHPPNAHRPTWTQRDQNCTETVTQAHSQTGDFRAVKWQCCATMLASLLTKNNCIAFYCKNTKKRTVTTHYEDQQLEKLFYYASTNNLFVKKIHIIMQWMLNSFVVHSYVQLETQQGLFMYKDIQIWLKLN